MTRSVGIICEYNPPHKGHTYQLQTLAQRYPDAVRICIMGGHFTQRGTPSAATKYARAKAALLCGADLVLELPFPWSMAPAELFARGGVSILDALDVDMLCFGAESDSIKPLLQASSHLDGETFLREMDAAAKDPSFSDMGYPLLRDRVIRMLYGEEEADLLRLPNNMLGAEYLRAIRYCGRRISPIAIKRCGAMHDAPAADGENEIASASAIRKLLCDGDSEGAYARLPSETVCVLREEAAEGRLCLHPDAAAGTLLLHCFRRTDPERLSQYAGLSGGIAQRLCRIACSVSTLEAFFAEAQTKKYTNASLRRAAWYGFFLCSTEELRAPVPYTLLLAANERGTAFLSKRRKDSFPILTRPAAYRTYSDDVQRAFLRAQYADEVYGMLLDRPIAAAEWMRMGPYIARH
ncbi:MAG: nucleotidyltransferase family protein [Clostridia bacterium]|nr:nucleotidyltransferase family protein [Clostridia bacterium]